MRVQPLEVQVRRHGLVAQHQHRLDQARHARSSLGMAYIGLDRTQVQGPLALLAKHCLQCMHLDRVTQRCAGTVRFNIVHRIRREFRIGQRLPYHGLLCQAVGRRQTGAAAILVDGRAANHRMDAVTRSQRVRQFFQHQHTTTLTAHIAIGIGIKSLAVAVWCQHAALAEVDGNLRRQHQVDTRHQRQPAFTIAQRLHGKMRSHQRRRTGRINRHTWALKTKGVRNPARSHTGGIARTRRGIAARAMRRACQQGRIVIGADAQKHAGTAAHQRGRGNACVFQCLPGHFQQQALLRVNAYGFTRRDAEKQRVKLVHLFNETAVAYIHLARHARCRVIQAVDVPALGRHLHAAIAAAAHGFPEFVRVVAASREAAAQAHHGNRG